MRQKNSTRAGPERHRIDLPFPGRAIALIVGAGVIAYANGLDNPFIWDDQTAIVNNETIRSIWPPWRPFVPPLETPVSRRPLVNASFALNYAVHGYQITGYHIVNLALHLLAACLLFGIVRRTLSSDRLRDQFGTGASRLALLAALVWVLHPLLSEIVNYSTQRTTAMAGLFFLATMYAAIRGLGSPQRWHPAAAIACVLGMLSKEEFAVAPLVIVLYDRVFAFTTVRKAVAVRGYLYAALAAAWIPLACILALRPHSTVGFSTNVTPWTYLLNQAQMVPHYLRLAAWPDALVLDYGLPRLLSFADVAGYALVVALLLVATLVALQRWPAVGFLGAVFFLTLAPSSSVVPIATEAGAERRMYLPLAALAVLGTVAGAWFLRYAQARAPARVRRPIIAFGLVIASACVAGLGVRTVYRNAEFASARSIWRHSVERWPHGRARLSYAAALVEAGETDAARQQMQLAVHDFPVARYALGTELAAERRYDEAALELSTFINAAPRAADRLPARILRGQVFAAQGRTDVAVEEFRTLVGLFPSNLRARENLANLLLSRPADRDEAASHYRRLLQQHPDHTDWLVNLGVALASTGRTEEALGLFQRALEIDPMLHTAHVRLAQLLLNEGKTSQAADHAAAVIAAAPGDATAHNLLGVAQAMEGRFTDAMGHFEASVEIDPGYADAHDNLERARHELGLHDPSVGDVGEVGAGQ